MPTNILTTGTTAANSADIVVTTTPVALALKGPSAPYGGDSQARVQVQMKDDAGSYFQVDEMHAGKPAIVLHAAGTYRVSRSAGPSVGVFQG